MFGIDLRNIPTPSFDNPWVYAPVIIMIIGVTLPCFIWFARNFIRIILNKNIEWLNRSLKWFALLGLIMFIISIVLIVLVANGVLGA